MAVPAAEDNQSLPYWLVNVPESERPAECPNFLINANEKDQGILSTPDAEYHVLTWAEAKDIIGIGHFRISLARLTMAYIKL
jgi:hypothetical protein